jgi:cytochrome P450
MEPTQLHQNVIKGPHTPVTYPRGPYGDLLNLDTFRHGHPTALYKILREAAPIYWHDEPYEWGEGFWAITKYEDVVAISKNPETFSSETGGHQIQYGDPAKVDVRMMAAITGNMIAMDPPLHQVYRKMVTPAFTPKALAMLDANMHHHIDEIINSIGAAPEIDFAKQIAEKLPIYTLADLLGVPIADREKLLSWTNTLVEAADPAFAAKFNTTPEMLSGMVGMEMFTYGQWLFGEKKKCPAHDLMSAVAHAKPEGGDIPQIHLDGFFVLMVIAGNETTRNTISGMMKLLSQNPDQKQLLLHNLELLPAAVDEALRVVAPVIHFRRTATKDTELRGQKIKAGDKIVMWYGAANRDEDIFLDAERFEIQRHNAGRHLSFGVGEHFCLGSQLGKVQIERMYHQLLTRFPKMEMCANAEYIGSNFISGIKSLRVKTG